jgi:signal peptidase I
MSEPELANGKLVPAPAKGWVREYLEAIAVALALALVIRTFVVQAFKIPSGSMEPTLLIGDHILVNKFLYGIEDAGWQVFKAKPQRSDIVVFEFPQDEDKDFIKRIVATSGEEIRVVDKNILIDGKEWKSGHEYFRDSMILPATHSQRDNFGPETVPKSSLFMMGDNRDNSNDSRFWKYVDMKKVKGRAFVIYWSWDNNSSFVRWKRLGKLVR